ncbi:lipid droplet phospholipase 1 [Malania oleifera]|uniref:lipid droplet phospholipase 1 n=1 Tax=Malania oleifera TaxID=397392 RepID=UPI0025AE38B9|nr:lipid droplet phospholipase 1 [Malania oleifera]
MASAELQGSSDSVQGPEEGHGSSQKKPENIKNRRRSKKRHSYLLKFGCFRSEDDDFPTVERSDGGRKGLDMVADPAGERRAPAHLVILVNGLVGSAQNWRYAAKQFLKKYSQDVIAHCSECNPSRLTFGGVDVMGERLAQEVISVIKRYPDVQKISFVGHSLGGLVARYAIARLYGRDLTMELSQGHENHNGERPGDPCLEDKYRGKIAGLEPMNFITFATPHLGSRGHKQVPVFCGFNRMERAVSHISWFLGRTGRHLFLTDHDDGKQPLLLRMVNDCENLPFMSALQSFRRRVAYANVHFDQLVGWSTSSIRKQNELPKRQQFSSHDKYPHIVNVEEATVASSKQEVSSEANIKKSKTIDMEEKMIRGLTKVSWERVDVDFKGSRQRFLAHSTIQVKSYCINSDGADVVLHMADNFLL